MSDYALKEMQKYFVILINIFFSAPHRMFKTATYAIVSVVFVTETLATKLALTSKTDSESEQIIVGAAPTLLGGGLVYPGAVYGGVGAVLPGAVGLAYPGFGSTIVGSRVLI